MIEITSKIKTYEVHTVKEATPEEMAETVKRPKATAGKTYKLKPIGYNSALYLTINNITLNEGTEHEETRPFEMFINTKEVEHFQWVTALTRVISAVFRKGGDINFLVEELSSIFDPKGGYWDEIDGKSIYVPSVIAGIGLILKEHLAGLSDPAWNTKAVDMVVKVPSDIPIKGATLCAKCNVKAVVMLDGCPTCLDCGDSKCG